MSTVLFYQDQAAHQQAQADAATLENVRDRCQRASNAWAALAARSERADNARATAAAEKSRQAASEESDRGFAT